MFTLLQKAADSGFFRSLDIQLARLLSDDNPCLALLIAKLSAESGAGHVCLSIASVTESSLFDGRHPELAADIWRKANSPHFVDFIRVLSESPAVSDGSRPTPIVLQGDKLYLQRMWSDEGRIARFFLRQSHVSLIDDALALKASLAHFFPSNEAETDWQKVAAAVAATRQVSVISGGPGTGKTTTVARLLAVLLQLTGESKLRIGLAAPTGKAAARLTESLGQAIRQLPLTDTQRRQIPAEAFTLHRLLGVRPNSRHLRHNKENPLHLDVLIVDEASMVDLPMMARLIEALPEHIRFILLGDKDQLASVEAGAVLGDICRFAEQGYSKERAEELSQLTGYNIEPNISREAVNIRDSLCLLKKSYRFEQRSGIGQLAAAVNSGDGSGAINCFSRHSGELAWFDVNNSDDYFRLLETCLEGYLGYLERIDNSEPLEILHFFNQFRLLCALRSGPFGVDGLNARIEQLLHSKRFIQKSLKNTGLWYPGRPVMISRNDSALGLYNGDIGIALRDSKGVIRVYFQLPDGSVKAVQPSRLPTCETAYAMTVHKSQGSEFSHTALVLPDTFTPLLSRELVYTAITRAKDKLSVFANKNILLSAILTPTERRSGLTERLLASDSAL